MIAIIHSVDDYIDRLLQVSDKINKGSHIEFEFCYSLLRYFEDFEPEYTEKALTGFPT